MVHERESRGHDTMQLAKALKRKIDDRDAKIGVIGLGYVGLPLAVEFANAGFHVTGIDVDPKKVATIRAGKSHVEDVAAEEVAPLVKKKLLRATTDYRGSGQFDVIIICVPTPLRKTKDPDISYIVSALDELTKEVRMGQLVILESTTYPGTTEEVLRPKLESGGLQAGRDFFLAFSPERVDPGNQTYKTHNTPKVVGGSSPACTEVAAHLYRQAVLHVHPVTSTQVAEMIKLLENTFRAVNIGLVNEIALMCERLELDAWEVIDGAATKPFGFMPFYPGPGIGGHCIPLDPHYLSWKLKTLDYSARFIELASEINSNMPLVVVRHCAELLNQKRLSVKGAKILVIGVSYKRDTADLRESPALDIMRLLERRGAKLNYHDPYNEQVRMDGGRVYRNTRLTPANLARADLVLIVTDHSEFDYDKIVRHAKVVLDTRNATRNVKTHRSKVHKL
jgi:UDP-N-acetyl-D-glucosamine dehydrogenase